MDIEHQFSAEYYQHLLSSLTINSRTLITELTAIAEQNTDNAKDICELIEARIRKCLPQYKLFSLYLLDSICKNIGNPYNLIFGSNLYKTFTETYLVVTDTPTRQNLINLFKTWANAKTSSGAELFPPQVINRIEEFIIKATTISQNNLQNVMYSRLTPDMLLREGNYLLQYVIMLNNQVEKLDSKKLPEEAAAIIRRNNLTRNEKVFSINNISESIMMNPKGFDANVQNFNSELQGIRKLLDEHSFQEQSIIKQYRESNQHKEELSNIKIEINVHPTKKYFNNFLEDITQDKELIDILKDWGKPITNNSKLASTEDRDKNLPVTNSASTPPQIFAQPIAMQEAAEKSENEEQPILNSLGMSFGSLDFMNSFLGSPKNEDTSVKTNNVGEDADSYDPEKTFDDSQIEAPSIEPAIHPSSMKRRNIDNDGKNLKKVRFAI